MPKPAKIDRDVVWLHAAFAAVCVIVLALPLGAASGWRVLGLVVLYNAALPLWGRARGYGEWLDLWLFLVPLSALQVLPDWFLAAELGTLVFPETGGPRIGPVPLAMAGMWTVGLFLIVWLGQRVEAKRGLRAAVTAVLVSSALVLWGSEAVLWRVPIWQAQGVAQLAGVGLYLLVPEVLLGWGTFLAYRWSRGRAAWERIAAACVVMLGYTGAVSVFYLLVEGG